MKRKPRVLAVLPTAVLPLVLVLPAASAASPKPAAAAAPPVSYTYDSLGRLATVSTSTGSATYHYDADGNLLSISRTGTAAPSTGRRAARPVPPSISSISPTSAPSRAGGTDVTIRGGRFSPHRLDDTVRIGGLNAIVVRATATVLVARVPYGARTGPVSVTTPAGSARSAQRFVIPAPQPVASVGARAQALPPLRAKPGQTALSGLVLQENGRPLPHVQLTLGGHSAWSDATGRFLLTGLSVGHHVLDIEGSHAQGPGSYGYFEGGVDLLAGRTNRLPWTIWMPALDTAHALTIPSPAPSRLVLRTPAIPGLELVIPKGTVLRRGSWGKVVRKITITPMPVNRTPVPLAPGMPGFFTVQPGDVSASPSGIKVIYPNHTGQPPGARIPFIVYNPGLRGPGWYDYGYGTVSKDGTQIVPSAKTSVWQFTPFGVTYSNPTCTFSIGIIHFGCPKTGDTSGGGDPVDLQSGLFIMRHVDLALPDVLPVSLTRVYQQADGNLRTFGIGMNDPFDEFITPGPSDNGSATFLLVQPDGSSVQYLPTATPGLFQAAPTPSQYFGSTLTQLSDRDFTLNLKDGTSYTFGTETAHLVSISDHFGNTLNINRDPNTGQLIQVTSPNGLWIKFTYGPCDTATSPASTCVTQVQDDIGRTVTYGYDTSTGHLTAVTDPNGRVTTYGYNTAGELITIIDPRKITYLTNTYDPQSGRVKTQTLANGGTYQYAYVTNSQGNAVSATVTDPLGHIRQVQFDANGYTTSDTFAYATSLQGTTTYQRDPSTELITAVTDPMGDETTYTYDAFGHIASMTTLAGTSAAATTSYTYDPVYDRLATIQDPLHQTTTLSYADSGSQETVTMTDPEGHQTVETLEDGQVVKTVDPLGNTRNFSYLYGQLVAVADANGNVGTLYEDGAGRLLQMADPTGDVTQYGYDNDNQLTSITDATSGVTSLSYDADGNLQKTTDPLGHITTDTYTSMNQLATSTDPLGHVQKLSYDLDGQLTKQTDRNGAVDVTKYDTLGRPTFVGYGQSGSTYQSQDTLSYYPSGLVKKVVDSADGTSSFTYSGLGLLTGETTPQGKISYKYNADSERTQMTVAGQTPVTYKYTANGGLASETQGANTVSLAYDAAGRQSSLTLPNGVAETYGYNAAGNTTQIAYAHGATTLGGLSYGYNADGEPVSVSGSLAATVLPAAMSGATYNADNELTGLNGATYNYDNNGDLLSDGASTYTWSDRGQLTSSTGPAGTASYGYDPLGRRVSVTTGGATADYLYDGSNPVQQSTGGSPTLNLLTGLQPDQIFTLSGSNGSVFPLTDALGSTVATTSSTGTLQTSYSYGPYGQVATAGAASADPFQFTGQQNDGTGLYYDHARYYSAALGRFISQDPLGLSGGTPNMYEYTADSPTLFTDPSGLCFLGFGCPKNYSWQDYYRLFGQIALVAGTISFLCGPLVAFGAVGEAEGIINLVNNVNTVFSAISTTSTIIQTGIACGNGDFSGCGEGIVLSLLGLGTTVVGAKAPASNLRNPPEVDPPPTPGGLQGIKSLGPTGVTTLSIFAGVHGVLFDLLGCMDSNADLTCEAG
jgi:RHS repeat-associated protein